MDNEEQKKEEQRAAFDAWFNRVLEIAEASGVLVVEGFDQTFEYLFISNVTPGNVVKRYVDTRVRLYCIKNNCE